MELPLKLSRDLFVLPSSTPAAGGRYLPVHAFVLRGSHPVLVDTGVERRVECGAVNLCGPCEGSSLPLHAEFTLGPDVARYGGEITVGSTMLVFDVSTCTLRTTTRFCSPWTDDVYVLRDGVGTGTAYGHCDTGGATCDCEVALACTPTRLR